MVGLFLDIVCPSQLNVMVLSFGGYWIQTLKSFLIYYQDFFEPKMKYVEYFDVISAAESRL